MQHGRRGEVKQATRKRAAAISHGKAGEASRRRRHSSKDSEDFFPASSEPPWPRPREAAICTDGETEAQRVKA